MGADLVSIVEAAYDVEGRTADAWLARLLDVAQPQLDLGDGVAGYFVDCSDGGFRTSGYTARGARAHELVTLWERYNEEVPLEGRRAIHMFGPAGYNGRLPPRVGGLVDGWTAELGQPRTLGVNAIDATLVGCSISGWALGAGGTDPTEARIAGFVWVSAHVAAGARLLRRLGAADGPDAVIAPDGRVLHAERDARDRVAREALRDAAVSIDRVRTPSRRTRDDAVESWQALVSGRWSLLDHFDRDGRRFFVAKPNEPDAAGLAALTSRERQVANAAALGHSDKLIAYELGIAKTTVASLLGRARRKLGARTRVELVRRLRAAER